MEEEKIMDQSQLAEDLSKKIQYDFAKSFLVKPLDPIMIKKEFDKPVVKDDTPKKDENGVEAVDYDKVETEVKEVESDYRKGVVLKIPFEYRRQMDEEKFPAMPIKVGDILVYKATYAKWFDLLKDTHLVSQFDIVAIETPKA